MFNFIQRAKLLGLAPDNIFRGVLSIPSLERLKQILDDGQKDYNLAELLYRGHPDSTGDNLARQLSRKILSYCYGGRELTGDDMRLADTAIPLQANVISIPEKTIDSEWNLNLQTPAGGLILSIGKLTIKDGGYIVISNRALDLTVDELVREGTASPPFGFGTFNIFGVDGAMGAEGDSPAAPGQAGSGNPGNCSSAGIAGDSGGSGTPGAEGIKGGRGMRGEDGKPSLEAVIRFTKSISTQVQLTVLTRSGAGGKGGAGGAGSKGGQGGNGGDGANCGCTGSAGGSGAQGGKGGTGGTGGEGGNGVDAAANVVVILPASVQGQIDPRKEAALPGRGGDSGARGDGGAGGEGGAAGNHNDGGSKAGSGGAGDEGETGASGTVTGKPAEILIQPF